MCPMKKEGGTMNIAMVQMLWPSPYPSSCPKQILRFGGGVYPFYLAFFGTHRKDGLKAPVGARAACILGMCFSRAKKCFEPPFPRRSSEAAFSKRTSFGDAICQLRYAALPIALCGIGVLSNRKPQVLRCFRAARVASCSRNITVVSQRNRKGTAQRVLSRGHREE